MRHPALLLGAAVLATACLAAPPRLAAQPTSKVDGGFTEAQVSAGVQLSRNQPQELTFTWYPEIPVGDAGYALSAFCFRTDRLGGPPGNSNRLLFNGTLAPVESNSIFELKQKRARLTKRGIQNRVVLWSGRQFEEIAAAGMDGGVVVHFEIGASGGVNFGDMVGCEVAMTETNPRGIVAGGGSAASASPTTLARKKASNHPHGPRR